MDDDSTESEDDTELQKAKKSIERLRAKSKSIIVRILRVFNLTWFSNIPTYSSLDHAKRARSYFFFNMKPFLFTILVM